MCSTLRGWEYAPDGDACAARPSPDECKGPSYGSTRLAMLSRALIGDGIVRGDTRSASFSACPCGRARAEDTYGCWEELCDVEDSDDIDMSRT